MMLYACWRWRGAKCSQAATTAPLAYGEEKANFQSITACGRCIAFCKESVQQWLAGFQAQHPTAPQAKLVLS